MTNKRKGHYESDDDPQWAHLQNAKGTPTYREKIEEDGRRKAANRQKERFVRLGEIMTGSPAWKALGRGGRDAYSWIERRYRGNNNGKIPMGARALAEQMGVDKDTANRYLRCCEALGFIKRAKHGHFGDRVSARRATRWRLTNHSTNGDPPTRDYQNLGLVEAYQAARGAGKRDPKRLHPGRKRNFVRPQITDTDPVSVHGLGGFASANYGQSTATPGGEPETAADDGRTVGAPRTGRSTSSLTAHVDAAGKIAPSSSKQKSSLAHHAKRSAAAKPLNGADAPLKEKISAIEKARKRELKNLARKFR